MGLFDKIFGKPGKAPRRSTRRERELDAEIEQELQRSEHLTTARPRTATSGRDSNPNRSLPSHTTRLAIGDEVRWSNASNGKGSGTVVKIVRRRGLGAETTIAVLDSDNNSLLRFFTDRPDYPASLSRTGARVTRASAIARHKRGVATRLGVSTQSPRVSHLGDDWGEYTED